jgi:glutamate-1-semialdehyde aminotransferase
MTKEMTPTTPDKSPNLESILEPVWTPEKVEERKQRWAKELREASPEERERLMIDGLSTLMARQCQHLEALNIQDLAAGSHQERISFLHEQYNQLCLIHDQWKQNFWLISSKQGEFKKEVEKELSKLNKRIEKLEKEWYG